MSPFIKDESVQSVLEAANIVEVVSGYTSLRKRGSTHSGLCPFHQEKTPSFTVSADKGLYYCFGCGEGGDVVRFMERTENLTFSEAIEQLGERFGVPIKYEEGGAPDAGKKERDSRLLQLLDRAAKFYEYLLWESNQGQSAKQYLEQRGLGREVCGVYRVGLAPPGWRGLHARASKEGFTDRELEDAGLLVRHNGKTYDRFRGRLMFPLVDHRGRVVGFGGRTLADETPKYLNSPEGPLYRKGRLLYGLYQARKAVADADEVIVVEGYTDVLALTQAGTGNVVASMGTALTDAQVGLMTRFTKNVTFMFDADRAGTEAMLRSGRLARGHSLRPMCAVLPTGTDPADLAVSGGKEAVDKVTATKISLLGFELRQALARGDTSTSEGRVRVFEEVRQIMAEASSVKEREEEIPLLADRLRLTPESVALLLKGEPGSSRGGESGGGPQTKSEAPITRRVLGNEATDEQDFLMAAVCHPAWAAAVLELVTPEHFVDPTNREVFLAVREYLDTAGGSGGRETALAGLQARASGDSESAPLFARLVMGAEHGAYDQIALQLLLLRLQEHFFVRRLREVEATLRSDAATKEAQERQWDLAQKLNKIRVSINLLDPDEQRA